MIRHPETEANVRKVLYGRTDSWYSPKGLASIDWVLEQTAGLEIEQIYSSSLRRASYLAEKIAEYHSRGKNKELLTVQYDDRLLERNFGILENKSYQEARELYGEAFDDLWKDVAHFPVPQGETLSEVKTRVTEFLEDLKNGRDLGIPFEEMRVRDPVGGMEPENREEKVVLVVAHSMVIRSMLAAIMDIPLARVWHFDLRPAGMVEILFHHRRGMITRLINPK